MRASAEQDVRRPFAVGHDAAGRSTDDGHHFAFGIERNLSHERCGQFQILPCQSGLGRHHQQRPLRGIADHLPGSILLFQRRPVAEHSGRQEFVQRGRKCWVLSAARRLATGTLCMTDD